MPRKPKATRAAEATVLDATPAPARRGRPPRAKTMLQAPAEDSMAASMGVEDPGAAIESDAAPMSEPMSAAEPTPAPAKAAAAPSKSAAQWDPAADTVQFDWPEIEQTASRPGPNQVMAKLLVAARAEGANSRWPFGAA
jgi:hypothetical protein